MRTPKAQVLVFLVRMLALLRSCQLISSKSYANCILNFRFFSDESNLARFLPFSESFFCSCIDRKYKYERRKALWGLYRSGPGNTSWDKSPKITSNSLECGGELTLQMHPYHSLLMEDPTTREKPVLSPQFERSVRFLSTGRGITMTLAELGI